MKSRLHFRLMATVLSLALIMTFISSGCTQGGGTQQITFVAAQYSNATEPYWKGVIANFEKANPNIKVNLQVVGWDVIAQKVNTLISTNQAPDLLNVDLFSAYASDGLLLDPTTIISSDLKSNLYPSLMAGDQVDGKQVAIPFITGVRSLYYNKDIFAKAGISTPPKTWSELEADSLAIKSKTGTDAMGIEMTTYEGEGFFAYFTIGNGGGWKSNGKWSLNSDANIEGITFMNKLINTDKVTNASPTAINRDQLMEVFIAGKLAMMIAPNSFPTQIKKEAPNLNYGIAPMPVNDGKPQTALYVQDSLMAFKSTKSPDAVGKLIDFIYQDSNYQQFCTNEGFLPCTKSVGQTMSKSDPNVVEWMNELNSAQTFPFGDPRYPELKLDAISAVQKVILNKSSVKDALDALQKQAEGN